MSRQPTKKEKDFCTAFVLTGDFCEAAKKAGYRNPEKDGLKLIYKDRIRSEIEKLKAKSDLLSETKTGLKRIAFGSVSDAVSLMYSFLTGEVKEPQNLDLFMISEIKMPKGGGLEIKFFDRLKALSLLSEIDSETKDTSASDFISAINLGAKSLNENSWSSENEV